MRRVDSLEKILMLGGTLAIAYKLNAEQTRELLFSAFPDFRFYEMIVKNQMSLADANDILDEQALDLLGTSILND